MLAYQMFGGGTRASFNPFRDVIFSLAMDDPPSFEAIMAISACHNDALHQQKPGAASAFHRMKALRLLQDRISNSECQSVSEGTIFTTSALWCLETHYGNDTAMFSHISGLRQMIIDRGGLETLETNPKLQMIIAWCMLALPGVMSFGRSKLLESSAEVEVDPVEAVLDPCRDEVQSFLEKIQQSSQSRPCPYKAESFAFQQGSPLQRLLSGPCIPRVGHYGLGKAHVTRAICRLAILLHIHSIFLDFQASADLIRHHMRRIRASVIEHELDRNLNVDSAAILLWAIMKDECAIGLENPARTWQVARMISVAKSKTLEWVENVAEMLLGYLTGKVDKPWTEVQ